MKNLTTYLKLITLAIVGASLVACGNKDSDSRRSGGGGGLPIGVGACATCTSWGGQGQLFLGSGYGSASFPMAMSIELLGDQTEITYLNSMQMDPSKTYGTILNGTRLGNQTYLRQAAINVSASIPTGQCILPAGTYNLTPTSNMGSYAGGSFVIPQFEMTNGSSRFVMSLQQGAVVAPYVGGPPAGFGALLVVLAGPSKYNPAQTVNCNDPGFQLVQ